MSYPYGPENYPTFEKLESDYNLDALRSAYYYDLHRMGKERVDKCAREKLHFEGEHGENEFYGSLYHSDNDGEPTVEDRGIAFAHALEYVFGDESSLDRFFQDLFSMLEDKIVSRADAEENEWYEDDTRMGEAAAIKKILDKGDSEQAEMYAEDYKNHRAKHEEFARSKMAAVCARANESATKHGVDCTVT